jgi:signal peptidase I
VSHRLLPRRTTGTKKKSTGGSLLELVTIVAVALGLALGIQAFLVKPFRIPSESMVPTLQIGQRVLVNRVSGHFGDYDRGDILVFKPPEGAETNSCGRPAPARRPPRSARTRTSSSGSSRSGGTTSR